MTTLRVVTANILCAVLLISCSAPHDNPLDTSSPWYMAPYPSSAIEDLAIDSLYDQRCRITWTAPERATTYQLYSALPDWDGSDPEDVDLYQGELPGAKPVGARQKVWIDLPAGQTRGWALFSFSHDGLMSTASNILVIPAPRVDHHGEISARAASIHIAQWSGLNRYELEVTATIADSDTVDHVWVEFNSTDIGTLAPLGDDLTWRKRFVEGLLPSASIEDLVGNPIFVNYFDRAGFLREDFSTTLVRVVYDVPEWISPAPNDSLDTVTPYLQWLPYDAEFSFTYSVEIRHVPQSSPETPLLVYSRYDIDPDSTGHQVEADLPSDPLFLYWVLIVEDDFGNRAVSLESNFRVIESD